MTKASNTTEILDYGYVRFIEAWGHGDAGIVAALEEDTGIKEDMECGIIEAARQSTQGSFRGWETDQKLLAYLYNNKHSTPFEFAGMVIEVKAPIAVFREWHRHRTQSYNEMSARYAPLPDTNYLPSLDRCLMVNSKNRQAGAVAGADDITHERALSWLTELSDLYEHCEAVYQTGLGWGIPKELARLCLPVGRYSQMRASTCLRNWLAFLTLRMDPQAQWEIRMYANAVGNLIAQHFPKTWSLFITEH